jgi:hypothetical protein
MNYMVKVQLVKIAPEHWQEFLCEDYEFKGSWLVMRDGGGDVTVFPADVIGGVQIRELE